MASNGDSATNVTSNGARENETEREVSVCLPALHFYCLPAFAGFPHSFIVRERRREMRGDGEGEGVMRLMKLCFIKTYAPNVFFIHPGS